MTDFCCPVNWEIRESKPRLQAGSKHKKQIFGLSPAIVLAILEGVGADLGIFML